MPVKKHYKRIFYINQNCKSNMSATMKSLKQGHTRYRKLNDDESEDHTNYKIFFSVFFLNTFIIDSVLIVFQ